MRNVSWHPRQDKTETSLSSVAAPAPPRAPRVLQRMLVAINPDGGFMRRNDHGAVIETIRRELEPHYAIKIQRVAANELVPTIETAVRERFDIIVAGGGDGTLSGAAGVLADTGVCLGILPLGTRNHFAADVLGTTDFAEALRILSHANVSTVDVGEVNGNLFINNASIGLYPYAVEEREAQEEHADRSKSLATVFAAVKTLFRRPLVRTRIHIHGEVFPRLTPFVFVGNNAYSLELRRESLRPRLDAGELCVIAAKRAGVRVLFRLAFEAWRQKLAQSADLDLWRSAETRVETRHKHISIALDGEVVRLETPLHFRSRPGALRVIAPPFT